LNGFKEGGCYDSRDSVANNGVTKDRLSSQVEIERSQVPRKNQHCVEGAWCRVVSSVRGDVNAGGTVQTAVKRDQESSEI